MQTDEVGWDVKHHSMYNLNQDTPQTEICMSMYTNQFVTILIT